MPLPTYRVGDGIQNASGRRAGVIAGVVLAAGTSSRMGRPKQLLELAGKPLLQHVVDAAAASSLGEIVVVLGHEADAVERALVLPRRARTVVNPDYSSGQSSSLRVGLDALPPPAEAALILLGDQPGVSAVTIDAAIAAFRASPKPFLRAVFEGRPSHPVVIARSQWRAAAASGGDAGARGLLERAGEEVEELELGAPLGDVDTWSDYEAARRSASPGA
jgi:molybdenum cofactor cytidylyltransferase